MPYTPTDSEYYRATIASAWIDDMHPDAIAWANELSTNGAEFDAGVQAWIKLDDIVAWHNRENKLNTPPR